MGADLHIHIFEGITEEDLRKLNRNTLGSKYFAGLMAPNLPHKIWMEAMHKVNETSNIWIGEVSWLKAGLTGDEKTFVPDAVGQINEIIGENLPTIDDDLITKVSKAFDVKNKTSYDIAEKKKVVAFLRKHKGKQVFTVSW